MGLCLLCSGLTIAKLYPPNIYNHAENLATLEASAQDCRLCKMIHWCTKRGNEFEHRPQLNFDGACQKLFPYAGDEARNKCSIKLQIIPRHWNSQNTKPGFTHVGIWMMYKWMVADMTLCVEEGDELGSKAVIANEEFSFISGRVLVSESPPQAHFDVAKGWLDQCEANHRDCCDHDSEIVQLPTRVIFVAEEGQNPYLDDKEDWERESSRMGSIFYDSTLTLAATDSPDSSKGLFIPRPPYDYYEHCNFLVSDIIALPRSFGDHRGQAYIIASTWGVFGPPASQVELGILQTRGWVMQEKYLARRTLHFLVGQMVWVCCERILGQSGFSKSFKNSYEVPPRMQIEAFAKGFERSYEFAEYDEDDESNSKEDSVTTKGEDHSLDEGNEAKEKDDDVTSKQSPFVTSMVSLKHGRASSIVDLRDPQYQTHSAPTLVTRELDNVLYNFLDVATRHTIYHVWYSAVKLYNIRQLTYPSDKLPALAGIASRVHAITHDEYLAGHWRRDLERSLFWQVTAEFNTCTPARVKQYRAPSWSWASVDGAILFNFVDLAPNMDEPASIEILGASTEVVGGNPFGCISSARLVIKASVVRATWNADLKGWMLDGAFVDPIEARPSGLKLFRADGDSDPRLSGSWEYDDRLNGLLPGPLLTPTDSWESAIVPRLAHEILPWTAAHINNQVHGKEFMEKFMWERGTYAPEELVLVKGPVRQISEYVREERGGRETNVDVLVLAKAEGTGGKRGEDVYERVGVGRLSSWDAEVEKVEILTVV
ncbi:Nn.00g080150.m01.CDS01 [Neocucurbitaria sp. VM-36]